MNVGEMNPLLMGIPWPRPIVGVEAIDLDGTVKMPSPEYTITEGFFGKQSPYKPEPAFKNHVELRIVLAGNRYIRRLLKGDEVWTIQVVAKDTWLSGVVEGQFYSKDITKIIACVFSLLKNNGVDLEPA